MGMGGLERQHSSCSAGEEKQSFLNSTARLERFSKTRRGSTSVHSFDEQLCIGLSHYTRYQVLETEVKETAYDCLQWAYTSQKRQRGQLPGQNRVPGQP